MTDDNAEQPASELDLNDLKDDLLFGLDLTPDWARKPASTTEHQPARPPRRRDEGGRRPRSQGRRDGADARRGPPSHPKPGSDRARPTSHRPMPRRSEIERAPVSIAVVPEGKQLSAVVRRIRRAKRAYLLLDVAHLFLANADACRIKISASPQSPEITFHICKVCRETSTDQSLLADHLVEKHLESFFSMEEKECPPPEGQFVCVARCGMSGELLGPPNHHSYAEQVQRVHTTRYPGMPIDEYRKRIEMVRDAEVIEQWKDNQRKKIVYRARKKGSEELEEAELTWSDATNLFNEKIAGSLVTADKRVALPMAVAMGLSDRALLAAVRDAWSRESRFPRSILFALRAAFRHMGLHVFRNENGVDVVSSVKPAALDAEHVVDDIRAVLTCVTDNPGATTGAVVEKLSSDGDGPTVVSRIEWLVEKGHLIEYSNGVLALPSASSSAKSK